MFVTRNVIDRILPFFALVTMNFLIIRAIKREQKTPIPNHVVGIQRRKLARNKQCRRTLKVNC